MSFQKSLDNTSIKQKNLNSNYIQKNNFAHSFSLYFLYTKIGLLSYVQGFVI